MVLATTDHLEAATVETEQWHKIAQQPKLSVRDSPLKRSEKYLKEGESLQPGMEPKPMWKIWMEIQWDPAHWSKTGGITGRKSEKKKSCCYMGWILALGRTGVGDTDYFPIFAKAFCLAWGKTIIFCPNFLLSKIFYTFASGGEEMMLEGNIFSINT